MRWIDRQRGSLVIVPNDCGIGRKSKPNTTTPTSVAWVILLVLRIDYVEYFSQPEQPR